MNLKSKPKLVLLAIACISFLNTYAQQNDTLEIKRNEKGKIKFIRLRPNAERKIQNGPTFLKNLLQAKPEDDFHSTKEITDKFGITHVRFQQYYNGIKIEGAEYILHGKNGNIQTANGDYKNVEIASVTPALTESQALTKALLFVHATKYKWEDSAMEKFIKQNTNNPNATYYPKGELVISKDYLQGTNSFKLSWKFTISSLQPNNEQLIFVDAITGEVINSRSLIFDVNTPLTAQTRYSGTLGITGDSFAGGFRLRENRNGVNVLTLNLQNSFNYAGAIDFTNASINFTNGNWPNFNQDQVALDAHWGAESVLNFWHTIFNRNSLDGNGMAITSYVHNAVGNDAYWDGNADVMNYGDGDGVTFKPLTALDVCAHEMGHGIQQFTSNITVNTNGAQEANALNEGLSDIWGACVEHWAAPNKQTWLIGEEVMANGKPCLRSLVNPKTGGDGNPFGTGGYPNTYHGQFWDNNGEPHTNSTVLSHWFYLLSQGGSGTNDFANSFSVTGIGIDRAEQIVFQAESNYLHAGATYADARNAMISATRDVNGGATGTCDEIAVTNAWFAVGVGAVYSGNAGLSISGDASFCTEGTYTVTNLPSGSSVSWSASPSGVVYFTNANGAQVTVNKSNAGIINLTATVTTPCGTYTVYSSSITVGVPLYGNVFTSPDQGLTLKSWAEGYNYISEDSWVYWGLQGTSASQYSIVGGYTSWTPSNYFPNVTFYMGPGTLVTFAVAVTSGGCSETLHYTFVPISNPYSYSYYSLAPNPVSSDLTIYVDDEKLKKQKIAKSPDQVIQQVIILDKLGNTLLQQKYPADTRKVTMNVSGLSPDMYVAKIFNGKKWLVMKFLKK